jgi:hypothetical protein
MLLLQLTGQNPGFFLKAGMIQKTAPQRIPVCIDALFLRQSGEKCQVPIAKTGYNARPRRGSLRTLD